MVTCRPSTDADHPKIIALLREFRNPDLGDDDWRRLLETRYTETQHQAGYVLDDEGSIVGFMAHTYSERLIGGRPHRLCNMSSWFVAEAYRGRGLALLLPLLKDKSVTITNLSPSPVALEICKKLGFSALCRHKRMIPILPYALIPGEKVGLGRASTSGAAEDPRFADIMRDHKMPHHHVLSFRWAGRWQLVVANLIRRRLSGSIRARFLRIHHLSDHRAFRPLLPAMSRYALGRGALGIIADDQYIGGPPPRFSATRPGMIAIRSADLTGDDIDGLYTELAILNL